MGMACSCETKDDQTKGQPHPGSANANKTVVNNPFLASSEFQILNRSQLDLAKKDSFALGKVLIVLFGRLTDTKCKDTLPTYNKLVTEKYASQAAALRVDCDNSPEILKDDVTDTNKEFPWIKAYAGMSFVGCQFDNNESALESLIQQAIVVLNNNKAAANNNNAGQSAGANQGGLTLNMNNNANNANVQANNNVQANENQNVVNAGNNQEVNVIQVESKVIRFDNFFQGAYITLQSVEDLNNAVTNALAEKKVLLVNFSVEDEASQRQAAHFERVCQNPDVTGAICNAMIFSNVLEASGSDLSGVTYPVIQSYVNGAKFEEQRGEGFDWDAMVNSAVAAIVR